MEEDNGIKRSLESKIPVVHNSMNPRRLKLEKESDDFCHRIAKLLLRQVFCGICKDLQDIPLRNIDLLIEATRIIALNLLISRCLRLDEVEVSRNPKLGITCISSRYSNNSEARFKIFSLVFENIPRFKNLALLNMIEKLDRYDLVKILQAIHEVSVYTPLEFIDGDTIDAGSYINEVNRTRKQRGVFYTPTTITEFICAHTVGRFLDERIKNVGKAIDEASTPIIDVFNEIKKIFEVKIIDPACGPGTFLSSSLKVLEARYFKLLKIVKKLQSYPLAEREKSQVNYWMGILSNKDEFLKYFERCLYGVDLDSAALEVASICLSLLSGRDPLVEGLKVLYKANLKEGNSLISELPPKSVRLGSKELQILLDLREKTYCSDLDEKNKSIEVYRDMVTRLQKLSLPLTKRVKRASKFFEDLNSIMVFCWELEFPEVFYDTDGNPKLGFDLLVMNPPYDLLKPNRLEYARLFGFKDIPKKEPEDFERVLKKEIEFYRNSGHYKLAISNVLNLYRLMVERALLITSSRGMLGFIVPSTLLCDESAFPLRKEILLNYKIEGVFDFLESAKVFPGVSQAVCIMIINKASRGDCIPLVMNLSQLDDLEKVNPFVIPIHWVKDFSAFRIPKVTETGWKILKKMHNNPKLSEIPWLSNHRGEVDLTFYKDCLSAKDTGYPLVRGVDISRYVLRKGYKKKESFIDADKFLDRLGNSIKAKHAKEIRIVGQQISNMMQRWRLKFCIVEAGTFVGNSCNYIYIREDQDNRDSLYLYFLALLNSVLLNWRFKLTSSNNHISNTELGMLPIKLIDISNSAEKRIFNLLLERVRDIVKNGISVFDAQLEACVFLLYGLTENEVKFILISEKATKQEIKDVLDSFANLRNLMLG
jgi:Alw26I/Eco31I/Esp3I family type II restriction m6 adenine DNA methyltransferase